MRKNRFCAKGVYFQLFSHVRGSYCYFTSVIPVPGGESRVRFVVILLLTINEIIIFRMCIIAIFCICVEGLHMACILCMWSLLQRLGF